MNEYSSYTYHDSMMCSGCSKCTGRTAIEIGSPDYKKHSAVPDSEGIEIMRDQRATHEDRARVSQRLGEALADGRITEEVHDARVRFAESAKTVNEASSVLDDLPARYEERQSQPSYQFSKLEKYSEKQAGWISELENVAATSGLIGIVFGCTLVGLGTNMIGHMGSHLGYGLPIAILGLVLTVVSGFTIGRAVKDRPGIND